MKLAEIAKILDLKCITGPVPDRDVTDGYTSDLLSDVMGKCGQGTAWITLHTHLNIVAVAVLLDIPAVIITGNNQPDPGCIEKAKSENVPLFTTAKSSFETSGELFKLLR